MRGFCLLLVENSNDEAAVQCRHIYGFMREWDEFLDRAEAFALDEKTASSIWERIAEKKLSRPASCPGGRGDSSRQGQIRDFVDCPDLAEGICLLTLPRCVEVCSSYDKK